MQFLFRLKSSSFQESWLDPPFLLDIYAVVGPEYFFFYLVCTNTCVLMLYTLLKCNYPSTNRICWPQGTLFNSWARQSSSHFWNRCPIRHQIVVKNTKKKADLFSGSYWKRGVQILDFWIAKRTKRNLPLKNHLSCRDDTKCMLHTIPYITSSWVKPCKIGTWGALPRVQHPLWVNHFLNCCFLYYEKQRHSFWNLFQLEDF